ncbi:hypothetical protein [Chitinophaga sp. RAB17]|uniref:hypothetical protein n=1 Tax=Chitinophaga sp. RAB17 TaxID=3233049 RepID=UPI003F912A91
MTPCKLIFCLFFLFIACTETPRGDHPYTSDSLTMKLPPYWKVIKDETDTAIGQRTIKIDDQNPKGTGNYLVICQLHVNADLKMVLEKTIESIQEVSAERSVAFKLLTGPEALRIGNLQALRATYEGSKDDYNYSGIFTVFHLDGKTYSLAFTTKGNNTVEKTAIVDKIIRSFKKYSE